MVKINWLGSLATTIWNLGFTSIFQWLRKDIWPWCACDRGSGQEGPSEVMEANQTLLTSCSSAAHSLLRVTEEVRSELTTPHMKERTAFWDRPLQLWEALAVGNPLMVFNWNLMPYNFKQLSMFLFSKATENSANPSNYGRQLCFVPRLLFSRPGMSLLLQSFFKGSSMT